MGPVPANSDANAGLGAEISATWPRRTCARTLLGAPPEGAAPAPLSDPAPLARGGEAVMELRPSPRTLPTPPRSPAVVKPVAELVAAPAPQPTPPRLPGR